MSAVPKPGLVSRALKRAILFIRGVEAGDYCRNLVKGETMRDLRVKLGEAQELHAKLNPQRKRKTQP